MKYLYLLIRIKIHIAMQQAPRRKAAKESKHKSKASATDTSNSISDTIRELSGQSEKRKNFYGEQKLQLLKEQAQREDVQLDIAVLKIGCRRSKIG